MPKAQLIDALRRGADGADMRAAVEMLIGYNDGDLLDLAEVRRHISAEGTNGARVYWTRLYAAAAEDADDIAMLGTTGIDALTLACALRAKVPIDSLARSLRQFDKANSLAAMRAFATALGIDGWAQLCGDNASQAREIDRLEGIVHRLREACQAGDKPTSDGEYGRAAYMRLDVDEPTDERGKYAAQPTLAIPVADVLDIIGADDQGGTSHHLRPELRPTVNQTDPTPRPGTAAAYRAKPATAQPAPLAAWRTGTEQQRHDVWKAFPALAGRLADDSSPDRILETWRCGNGANYSPIAEHFPALYRALRAADVERLEADSDQHAAELGMTREEYDHE
jgi:hypothetical protein